MDVMLRLFADIFGGAILYCLGYIVGRRRF